MSYPFEKKITLFLIHIKVIEKILNIKKIEVIAFLSKPTGLWAQYVLRRDRKDTGGIQNKAV